MVGYKETNCKECDKLFWAKANLLAAGKGRLCSVQCKAAYARSIKNEASSEERFWKKVNKTETCWLWLASLFKEGYGQFKVHGKNMLAHRFSWEITNGPIPKDILVLHRCPGKSDKRCVNPFHLYLGNDKNNVQDALNDGTFYIGSMKILAKLTESDIPEIRESLKLGESQSSISRRYGVTPAAISSIARNLTWTHV